MIIRCAIVDDEPLALELLESYVEKTAFLKLIGKYSSAIEVMNDLSKNTIDLIFLDIQMPQLNGLEFSKIVSPSTRIVFTTAFQQYAIDGYKVNALDYLLKPISYICFLQAANKALQWFKLQRSTNAESTDSLFVKSDHKLIKIDVDDILYIEGLKDYVKIYLDTSPRPILTIMSMKNLEQTLPLNKFIRTHRSYIIQKNKINIIEHNQIIINNTRIPISESYKSKFHEFLNNTNKMVNTTSQNYSILENNDKE